MATVAHPVEFEKPAWRSDLSILIGGLLVLAVGTITIIPVIFIIVNSFNVAGPGEAYRFGIHGWAEVFASRRTLSAIGYSFLLSSRTLIGIVVAFIFAWLLIRVRIPYHKTIEFCLWMAYFLPPLPIALSWILLLDPNFGLVNQIVDAIGLHLNIYSVYGILWVHVTITTVPIMVILLTPALRQMDASLEEAARMCGAGQWQTFKRILVPLLGPALLTIILASVIRNLEAFEIEQLLGRPAGIYVYATRIYDLIHLEPPLFSQAMALSALFLALLFVLALFYQKYTARWSFATISGRGVSFRSRDIGRIKYFISFALVLFIGTAVFLPLAVLVLASSMKFFGYFQIAQPFSTRHWALVFSDPEFLRATRNSLVVGLGTGGLGIVVYSLLGYVLVRSSVRYKWVVNLLVWLPWAIPGILLSLAFLWLLLSVQVLRPIYGTFGGFLLVLLVKEMPIGIHMLKTAFVQLSEELEQVARVCGAGWQFTFRRITVPLISPALVSVFAIVFVAALRDISTIILISAPSIRPLSLLMLEYSMANEMEAGCIIGIMLSAFAVFVAYFVRRLGIRFGTES